MRTVVDLPMHEGYRVWVTEFSRPWQPTRWNDIPPEATAVEPMEEGCVGADRAACLVEGFNEAVLGGGRGRNWAVAVPVVVRYDQDLTPGEPVGEKAVCMQSVDG